MHKNITLIISSFLFSLLFYQQQIGINFLLFSILVVIVLAAFNFEKFKTKKTLLYAACYIGASSFVFMYNSALTILVSMISFFAMLGSLTVLRSSLYIELLNGFYTTIAASFANHYNKMLVETDAVKKRNINYVYWFKIIGIPLVIVIVFIILYKNANPYFNEILSSIDLRFINLKWISFTILGYFLLLNISSPQTIQSITQTDLETNNKLEQSKLVEQSSTSLLQENQLGIILLILLNLLIGFFLATDLFYLSKLTNVAASSLSKAVHEGIYALITSIIFAIVIILYFFRGNLNFYKKNKQLKILTAVWILLNILLILITAYKNYLYVTYNGFTYKRIGVFIYLSLSFIGLVTTYIKVYAQYNLWYLLRKNSSIAFMILLFSSTLNWDQLITKYNTVYAQTVDFDYLLNLSDNNTILLKEYVDENAQEISVQQEIDIIRKYNDYTNNLKAKSWQELVYDNLKLKK